MDPGSARSGQFLFSTATVCIAPLGSLKTINPAVHSIGLTKNVKIDANPSHVELTQGIRQDVVASVTNKMAVTAGFEVYEMSAKNLAYGLGLDGSGLVISPDAVPVTSAVAAAASTVSVTGDQTASFPAGSWAFLQENLDDQVYVFKVGTSANTSGTTTITMASGYTIPTGMSFSTGARVGVINKIDADPSRANGYFTVEIIGTSIRDQRPMVIVFPKARITKGFGIGFNDSNFGSLPFEIQPTVPLAGDVGYDSNFRQMMSILSP